MPIISVEIMKTIDKRKIQKTTAKKNNKQTKKDRKEHGEQKLQQKGFLQLICKASLTFKSNLEPALSFILKQRKLYESKHVALECRCLKI